MINDDRDPELLGMALLINRDSHPEMTLSQVYELCFENGPLLYKPPQVVDFLVKDVLGCKSSLDPNGNGDLNGSNHH